ncbi:MAG: alginate export family protein, partial [Candidatus Marinimicrobia bacterium]|nr:alginate export family protein [Candidatus Neomarinimicrobiota bacterium]
MKQTKALILGVSIATLMLTISYGMPNEVSVTGQIRQRTEMNDKDFSASTSMSGATWLRTRLNIAVKTESNGLAFIQIQNSRKFGEETSTLFDGSADMLDFHQAYLLVNQIAGMPLNVKVGRMELAYANQRIIGAVGWHNVARSFDGVVANYKLNNISIDALLMTEVKENTVTSSSLSVDTLSWGVTETRTFANPKDFRGVWLTSNWKIGSGAGTRVDAYFLNNYNNDGNDLNRNTMGIYSKGNLPARWSEAQPGDRLRPAERD